VEVLTGVQIVIHPIDACVSEPQRLFLSQQAKTAADMQTKFLLDLSDHTCNMIHLPVSGAPSAGDDAVGTRV
jgi:hypothetical protein